MELAFSYFPCLRLIPAASPPAVTEESHLFNKKLCYSPVLVYAENFASTRQACRERDVLLLFYDAYFFLRKTGDWVETPAEMNAERSSRPSGRPRAQQVKRAAGTKQYGAWFLRKERKPAVYLPQRIHLLKMPIERA